MSCQTRLCSGLILLVLALPSPVSAQAPPTPPMTLWRFLGIPQAAQKVNAQIFNRRGNTPGLETKPPLKAISDPANLDPKMPPVIQKAAEIKQKEDLAPQKKKAIKYLAEIGCGCYDRKGEVTDAIVAAMDDCTEEVRLEAVEAIKTAASEDPCCNCGSKCCCNRKILEQLAKMAYHREDDGCYSEPSERVRQAAAEALTVCCTTQEPIQVLQEESAGGEGTEGAKPLPSENGEGSNPTPAVPQPDATEPVTMSAEGTFSLSSFIDTGSGTTPQRQVVTAHVSEAAMAQTASPTSPEMRPEVVAAKVTEVVPQRGEVTYVNLHDGVARVRFTSDGTLRQGTVLRAFHKFMFGTSEVGQYVVIGWNEGEAIIRRADGNGVGKLSRGDTIAVK